MTEQNTRYLAAFAAFLRDLGDTARTLAGALEDEAMPPAIRRGAAVGLHYLAKSVDLIPDGIESLGFLDDAFVCRVALAAALAEAPELADPAALSGLVELAAEAELVRDFLGDDHARLEAYVSALGAAPVRGHALDELLADPELGAALAANARAWADGYRAPELLSDPKSLVKLRAFFNAKLPV